MNPSPSTFLPSLPLPSSTLTFLRKSLGGCGIRSRKRAKKTEGGPRSLDTSTFESEAALSCSCRVLSDLLLWHERHRIAELFKAVNMVQFDASPILLMQVIGTEISIGFLGT